MSADMQKPKALRKWVRVLHALADGRSFNRFEAERELRDHVLPSTVADLQRRGLNVERKTERVPGYAGVPTDCCRYWLSPLSLNRAREILAAANASEGGRS